MRKIIQIAFRTYNYRDRDADSATITSTLFALCDDQTIWHADGDTWELVDMPPIPQDEGQKHD